MRIATLLLTALFAAPTALPAAAQATGDTPMPVHHSIEVDTDSGRVLVRVTIENKGERPVYVPREVAAGDQLFGRRFDVRNADTGTPVDYTGPMVKRGPITAADYLAIAPGTVLLNTLDITNAYAFEKGRHTYELRYAGPWLADLAKLDAPFADPVEVRFSYGAR